MTESFASSPVIESILAILAAEDWHFRQIGDAQIECDINGEAGSWMTRIAIDTNPNELGVRIISHLPVKVPAARRKEMAELMIRLNADFMLGNFFMLFSNGEIGFYIAFDPMNVELSKEMLLRHFYTNIQTTDAHLPVILAVAFGSLSAEDAYNRVKADQQAELEVREAGGMLQ